MAEENLEDILHHNQAVWFSLQHFAAADDEGRTEEPTESKIRKARQEGRVAKSAELAPAVVMFFVLLTLTFIAPFIVEVIADMFRYFFTKTSLLSGANMNAPEVMDVRKLFGYYTKLVLPAMLVGLVASALTMFVQVGFVFSTKPLEPDFTKIVPNLGRYLSKSVFGVEAFFNLGKSIFKVIIVGAMGFLTIQMALPKLITSPFAPLDLSSKHLALQVLFLAILATVFFFVIALIDFIFQKRQFTEQLKMTKQEVRDEQKEQEGSPQLKSKIRSRMLDYLRTTMMRNVPKADVLITNPTHFAIALEYTAGSRAPKLTAKGQDLVAQRMKELARTSGVPIIENKPLARALHANIEIGQEIPPEYWEVVSAIFVQVYKMTGKRIGI